MTRALERMHVNPIILDRGPQPKRLKLVDNAVAELEMMAQKGQVERLNATHLQVPGKLNVSQFLARLPYFCISVFLRVEEALHVL